MHSRDVRARIEQLEVNQKQTAILKGSDVEGQPKPSSRIITHGAGLALMLPSQIKMLRALDRLGLNRRLHARRRNPYLSVSDLGYILRGVACMPAPVRRISGCHHF
jgi:hypothetical protein